MTAYDWPALVVLVAIVAFVVLVVVGLVLDSRWAARRRFRKLAPKPGKVRVASTRYFEAGMHVLIAGRRYEILSVADGYLELIEVR